MLSYVGPSSASNNNNNNSYNNNNNNKVFLSKGTATRVEETLRGIFSVLKWKANKKNNCK